MGIENVKVEPVEVYVGTDAYQVEKITCVADVSSSLNNKYFIMYEPSGAQHLFWYNVAAGGTDPAISGYTSHVIAIAANDSATAVATATKTVIDGLSGFSATSSNAVITVTGAAYGYAIPGHDSQAAKTGFAFELSVTGDTFAKLGIIDGDIKVGGLSRSPVDVTSHQTGTSVLGQIFTGVGNPTMDVTLKEVVFSTYSKVLRYAAGAYKPVLANSTAVIGGGSSGLFGSPEFVKVVLHPVRLGIADKTNDYCFWKCTIDLDSKDFSGEKIEVLPIKVKAFNDDTKHPAVSTWMYGDWSQTLTP